jgi:hypothetical protein
MGKLNQSLGNEQPLDQALVKILKPKDSAERTAGSLKIMSP